MKIITNNDIEFVKRKNLNETEYLIKKETAITLVALVITIVVLLILAGISIQAITSTGLFGKAQQAKETAENKQITENLTLAEYDNKIDSFISNNRDSNVKSSFKMDQLTDNTVEFTLKNPGNNWTTFNQNFKLNDSIENYDKIVFDLNVQEGENVMRTSQKEIFVKNIKYNPSENEKTETGIPIAIYTLAAGKNVIAYELYGWFKDGQNFFVHIGGTNYSWISKIRINAIYGIKY